MFTGLLPIGTVVLLKNSTKKVMIIGFAQVSANDPSKVFDYAGCLFPEGYVGPDKTYLFNSDQVEKIYAVGYQDEEQMVFKTKIDKALIDLRNKEKQQDENDD